MNGGYADLPGWHEVPIRKAFILIVTAVLALVVGFFVGNSGAEVLVTPDQTPDSMRQSGMNEGYDRSKGRVKNATPLLSEIAVLIACP